MDQSKLRKLLFEKDKLSGGQNPSQSMPMNKSTPHPMSPGLPNPMGNSQPISSMSKPASTGMPKTIGAPKMSLPNPTAAPSVIGQQPSLPKPAKFGRMKKLLKPTKEF